MAALGVGTVDDAASPAEDLEEAAAVVFAMAVLPSLLLAAQ